MSDKSILSNIFAALKPYKTKTSGKSQGVGEIDVIGWNWLDSSIYRIVTEKKALSLEYREMSLFPEVADAVDEISFEAISPDKDGSILKLQILDAELSENENIVENIQKEFDYILNRIMDFENNAIDLFRKFYIEGELYAELKIDPEHKEKGVLGINYLPSYSMTVEYNENAEPESYTQNLTLTPNRKKINSAEEIHFKPAQIAYINSGIVDYEKNLVYSYLERAKVAYRQLKWMESAILIYRISRAPERRVFTIAMGKLPKNKQDEYMKKLIQANKSKKVYNPRTGDVDLSRDVMSCEEDYYFPIAADGTSSGVTTLPGGQSLDQIEDVLFFLKKLYKSLKIPQTRMLGETVYNVGKSQEIAKEEIKFAKYITSIRSRFKDLIVQIFFTHLQLKGFYAQYKLDPSKLKIVFHEDNSWKELKDLDILNARIDAFLKLADMKDIFPTKYLLKSIMRLSDDEIAELKQMGLEEGGAEPVEGEPAPEEKIEDDIEYNLIDPPTRTDKLLTAIGDLDKKLL